MRPSPPLREDLARSHSLLTRKRPEPQPLGPCLVPDSQPPGPGESVSAVKVIPASCPRGLNKRRQHIPSSA